MMEEVFSIIKSTLEQGENLKNSGFGSFVVKQKNDRRSCNPQTGETINVFPEDCRKAPTWVQIGKFSEVVTWEKSPREKNNGDSGEYAIQEKIR